MKKIMTILTTLLMTACAHNTNVAPSAEVILDHRADYANAQNRPELIVPPPLSDALISDEFNIKK